MPTPYQEHRIREAFNVSPDPIKRLIQAHERGRQRPVPLPGPEVSEALLGIGLSTLGLFPAGTGAAALGLLARPAAPALLAGRVGPAVARGQIGVNLAKQLAARGIASGTPESLALREATIEAMQRLKAHPEWELSAEKLRQLSPIPRPDKLAPPGMTQEQAFYELWQRMKPKMPSPTTKTVPLGPPRQLP